ncbi:MAG: TolC family protein [Elusimicrobiaceae bacterium]
MKNKIILLLTVLLFCAGFADAQKYRIKYSADDKDPLSLENAIRLALENNYNLLLTEQDVVISEQRLKEAKFLYLPEISFNAAATGYNLDSPIVLPDNLGLRYIAPSRNHNTEDLFYGVGVSATQYLYTGGRTSSTVSMANAGLKEAMSRYEAVKYAVIYQVKEAFFQQLFLQRKEALLKDMVSKAEKYVTGKKYKQWEKVLVQAELAKMNSKLAALKEELSSANLKLINVLNKELNSKVVITGEFDFNPINVDLAKATLWAMEFRPELKSALYKLEMDNISVKLSLARRYPNILLGVGYDRQGEDNLQDENIQATLALKLPFGYDYGTQLKQKRAEQRQSNLKRAAIEDSIRSEVLEAYNNLMFWQKETAVRISTWDSINKELGDLNYDTLSKEEAIKVFNYYYEAGVDYLEGIKEHMLALARLELAVGQDIRE